MPLFDSHLVVDWSAASVPRTGRDSIWTALSRPGSAVELVNHPTRFGFEAWLRETVSRSGRLLAGFDFSFGYPAGFASRLALDGVPPWSAVWSSLTDSVVDASDNTNNRFEVASMLNASCGPGPGPFWGCPPARVAPTLSTRKAPGFPCGDIEEFRVAERVACGGRRWISSSWQLLGAGSVGSQMLVGIPVLERLRRDPPAAVEVDVWPFTTTLRAPVISPGSTHVVLAEVWPSMVEVDLDRHPVRDACQVLALCDHLVRLDEDDALGALFEPSMPPATKRTVETEEGWILGVSA